MHIRELVALGLYPASQASGAGGSAVPTRPQVITHRGAIPYNQWGNGVNGRSDTRAEGRCRLKIGPYDVSQIELAFANFKASGNAAPEAAIPNDVTVEAALELLSPAITHRLFFDGKATDVMAPGCPIVRTDPLNIKLAANSTSAYARFSLSVAAGTASYPAGIKTPVTTPPIGQRDTGSLNSNAGSQVMAAGDMVAAGGMAGIYLMPTTILGIPAQKHPSVGFLGNSIAQGTGDTTDGNGNVGFIQRGLYSVNWNGQVGVTIPNLCMSVGGDVLANNLDNLIGKRAFWPFLTDIVVELSTNDIQNGATLATLQGYLTTIWSGITRTIGPYGVPVRAWQTLPMPRTNNTNNGWGNAAFQPGGVRDQLITWIKQQVGTRISGYIDPNPYVEDPNNHGLWLPSLAPADGTHPTAAGHLAAAQAVNAWAANLTV